MNSSSASSRFAVLGPYPRTAVAVLLLGAALLFSFGSMRTSLYPELLSVFEWMETTWFGYVGKTWGGAFALVQGGHLVSLGVLGGSVLFSDGRLLGLFPSLPIQDVIDGAHKVFVGALIVVVATGVFMVCGVAVKVYYLPVFWYKMLTLTVGVLFAFFVRKPLLDRNIDQVNPWVVRLVAISSVMVWFTVAATGRWIGFS